MEMYATLKLVSMCNESTATGGSTLKFLPTPAMESFESTAICNIRGGVDIFWAQFFLSLRGKWPVIVPSR